MADTRRNRGKRVALIILDGWGWAPAGPGNAISLARKPVWDALWAGSSHGLLEASGEAVGLPPGIMGNSEVGHLTLGSGRVIYQDLTRINRSIADGSFFENRELAAVMDAVAVRNGCMHLMGLLSDAGVHSSLNHAKALVTMARRHGVTRLLFHAFTDGRDTSPTDGVSFMRDLEAFLHAEGLGVVATVSGRYYAMDRDERWERLERAYEALVHGHGLTADSAEDAIRQAYDRGETDEFIQPTVISPASDTHIQAGDGVVFFNFRPDRAREITAALTQAGFSGFDRGTGPPAVDFIGMTEYDPDFGVRVAFSKTEPRNVLAEVVSAAGLTQLHIAETEKYAHVTFFFNGGREEPFPGETRTLIPSPRDVPTYDKKPEMSAYEIAASFEETLSRDPLDLTVLNFANADMVGHTGNIPATVEAIEHVDRCLGRILKVLAKTHARVVVTADHGTAERMLEENGAVNTAHTAGRVPLVVLGGDVVLREGTGLSDVAPTLLRFLGLEVPEEMTGIPLCRGE